ncbi:protein containing DUF81 [Pseudovibrio sp. FO-BEG1]|uniref:sulfite exporter TauE/SafE family protein n=1 Tax=Pseudovibrio sp. (strain FO-BEG1) TaxID=911045 RepID=UPI000238CE63|nr:sulfite exporter TauE/SafE family protein [Pseudovibrio sp. FO-BEG1]AEV36333.1 protein containing DUF81 [Pseudovibrio sp. FO-BEG1]
MDEAGVLGYSYIELSLIAATYFFAAFIKGFAGLGFTTSCLAILVHFIGLDRAIPLITIPALAIDIILVYESGNVRTSFLRFQKLHIFTIPGVVLGLWLLSTAPMHLLTITLGTLIILFYFYSIASKDFSLPPHLESAFASPVGFITGLLCGMTGSQLLPVAPYLISLRLPRSEFIQAINTCFTFLTLSMMIGLTYLGLLHIGAFAVSFVGLGIVYGGTKTGNYLGQYMSATLFRHVVLVMLLLSGVALIVFEVLR